jgi:hypothetical protein
MEADQIRKTSDRNNMGCNPLCKAARNQIGYYPINIEGAKGRIRLGSAFHFKAIREIHRF